MPQNLYLILGVAPDAEPQQITRAFRRLVRTLHPDAAPDTQPGCAYGTRERFEQVVAAYHVLHDPAARATYDRTLAAAGQAADHLSGPASQAVHPDGRAPLIAGPTVIHARPPTAPQAAIRIGPPIRLSD